MSLWVVVGGQFGSEGKGKVSAFITKREDVGICVRCGGPNSGHSFVNKNGENIVLRQLPTGFVNPRTRLLIPAGALIDPAVLKHEIDMLNLPPFRVGVDRRCFVVQEADRLKEQTLGLGKRISSTLCGVGAAQSRRVLRDENALLAKDATHEYPWLTRYIAEVSTEINEGLDHGEKVLIEGTQGFGLSLYHSDYYPHTTSRDTTAAGFLSEVGVSPRLVTDVVVVLRTFPIRVAGLQAGPLNNEISWEQLGKESGYPHGITERTSVTNKIRRVARFDWELARRAIRVNRPTELAINGLDYLDYSNFRLRQEGSLSSGAKTFVHELEQMSGRSVGYLGVGPGVEDFIIRNPGRDSSLKRQKLTNDWVGKTAE